MSLRRVLLDSSYVIGLLNPRDELHDNARRWFEQVRVAPEVWVTEAVLTEIANGLAVVRRQAAVTFLAQCYRERNFKIVSVGTALLRRALDLYRARPDKEWGLTDCISFIVMQDQDLRDALTADEHFVQAGFRALMLEEP